MLSSNLFLILVSGLGVLHGLCLAAFLWIYQKGNRTANKILSILLLILSIRVGKSVVLEFVQEVDLKIIFSGLALLMAIGPLFYFFTLAVTDKTFRFTHRQLPHFIPTLLGIGFGSWVHEAAVPDIPKTIFLFIFVGYYGHYLIYLIYSFGTIRRAKKSNLNPATGQLLMLLFYALLAIWVVYVLNLFDEFIPYIIGPILYTLIAYTVSFVIIQKGYLLALDTDKYKTTPVSDEQARLLLGKILHLVEGEKQFKNPDLSLKLLSEKLNVSTQILSMVINKESQMNFNSFINQYRVNEAISLFKSENHRNHTIASIAFEVGFNSISSFNTSFKNLIGKTPLAFRNEIVK